MRFLSYIFILAIVLLIVPGCNKNKCTDPSPEIEFIDFKQFNGDTAKAILTIGFKDCDGDIGVTQSDTIENLFMEYYERQNGKWVHIEPVIPFYYRIPVLNSDGASDVLDGEIDIEMFAPYYDPGSPYDTIRFEVYIKDQAENVSNTIFTPDIVVNK